MIKSEDTFTKKTIKDMMNFYYKSRKMLSFITYIAGNLFPSPYLR